jgi:pimeloyl-ACP methyl ester carboxylesterase
MSASFGALKQVDAGLLNVGYAEAAPADGPAVLLLHGWPYDIHSFAEVGPVLASAGYQVIVPFARGYGTSRFRSDGTVRNGQQAVLAVDVIALMDALGIDQAILGGFDWGGRSADIVAAPWPDRCHALVSVSGYLIGSQAAGAVPLPPPAEHLWWYQYYFATDRGRTGYEKYRREFSKLIWQLASPKWAFDDATFARTAAAFDNPDHVAIVIHNYRWRLGLGRERRNTTIWKNSSPRAPSSPCQPSPSKVMPMARRVRIPAPTRQSSRANTRIGPYPAASDTTCRTRLRGLSLQPSPTPTASDRHPQERNTTWPRSPLPMARKSSTRTGEPVSPSCSATAGPCRPMTGTRRCCSSSSTAIASSPMTGAATGDPLKSAMATTWTTTPTTSPR